MVRTASGHQRKEAVAHGMLQSTNGAPVELQSVLRDLGLQRVLQAEHSRLEMIMSEYRMCTSANVDKQLNSICGCSGG